MKKVVLSTLRRGDMNKAKYGYGCLGIIIVFFFLIILSFYVLTYQTFNHDQDIASREKAIDTTEKIERLTGFQLPDYNVIDYKSSGLSIFGEFQDTVVVVFRSVSLDSIQKLLDKSTIFHITSDSTGYDYINQERDFAIKIVVDKNKNTSQIMLFNGLVPAS